MKLQIVCCYVISVAFFSITADNQESAVCYTTRMAGRSVGVLVPVAWSHEGDRLVPQWVRGHFFSKLFLIRINCV
jgi:hypothetical protein